MARKIFTVEMVVSLKVACLNEYLEEKKGRPTMGKKNVLVEQLREAMVSNVPVSEAVGSAPQEADMGEPKATA